MTTFNLYFSSGVVDVRSNENTYVGGMLIIGQKAKNKKVSLDVCQRLFGDDAFAARRFINKKCREEFTGHHALSV